MAHATFKILTNKVGEGGLQFGIQVLRIQQLLFLNGYERLKLTERWDSATQEALVDFKRKKLNTVQNLFFMNGGASALSEKLRPCLLPDDPLLFELAYGARVLIRVAPGGRLNRASIAFNDVHAWCENHRHHVGFTWSDHAVWGLEGYLNWAIVTTGTRYQFDTSEPRHLNCTLYANLMMSVWHQGNAHSLPFNPSVKKVGEDSGILGDRYFYKDTKQFKGLADIVSFTRSHRDRLFCLEAGSATVGHEALLYEDRVYECNVHVGCHSLPLGDWLEKHPNGWISGPSPP